MSTSCSYRVIDTVFINYHACTSCQRRCNNIHRHIVKVGEDKLLGPSLITSFFIAR